MNLDHLMWACPDLQAGIAEIEALTGVRAEFSGSHPGLGTRNALLSLGETCYLEIIAPDPEQSIEGNFGGRLAALDSAGLLSWAVSCSDLAELRLRLLAEDVSMSEVRTTRRKNPAGETLTWQLLFVSGVQDAPFFIDWLACIHPATTSPSGCQIQSLRIETPDPSAIEGLLHSMVSIEVVESKASALHATIQTPKGEVMLKPLGAPVRLF